MFVETAMFAFLYGCWTESEKAEKKRNWDCLCPKFFIKNVRLAEGCNIMQSPKGF